MIPFGESFSVGLQPPGKMFDRFLSWSIVNRQLMHVWLSILNRVRVDDIYNYRWRFQIYFLISPQTLGEDEPILSNIFQTGWNQPPLREKTHEAIHLRRPSDANRLLRLPDCHPRQKPADKVCMTGPLPKIYPLKIQQTPRILREVHPWMFRDG